MANYRFCPIEIKKHNEILNFVSFQLCDKLVS
jgi:hypothetical protein